MLDAALFIIGLLLGALAVWLWLGAKLRESENRAAAAEATAAGLREQQDKLRRSEERRVGKRVYTVV